MSVPKKFDLSLLRPFSNILIVGSRRTGKTTMAIDLIKSMNIKTLVLTAFDENRYDKVEGVRSMRCNNESEVCDELTTLWCNGKKEASVVVFDGILELLGHKFFKLPLVRELLYNGRYLNKCVILTSTYAGDIDRPLRSIFDYVALFHDNSEMSRRFKWASFCSVYNTFEDFDGNFKHLTQFEHTSMFVDQHCKTYNIDDAIFSYKATLHE